LQHDAPLGAVLAERKPTAATTGALPVQTDAATAYPLERRDAENSGVRYMSDLVRIVRDFLYRDLAFILGGTLVIGSIAYFFRQWLPPFDLTNPPFWSLVLFPAMAYVVGYAVQDIGGIIGITFTGYLVEPNQLCRWLYLRFSSAPWRTVTVLHNRSRFQFDVHMSRLDVPPTTQINLDRVLDLKVIGMCVGGCSLLSSLILLARGVITRFAVPLRTAPDYFAFGLGFLFLLLGASLICG
jgi:hypothetical protein